MRQAGIRDVDIVEHNEMLGELNGIQEASWRATVELLGPDGAAPQQFALFPGEFAPEEEIGIEEFRIVSIRLSQNRCAGRDNGAPAG